jgi:hypothetical protein
VQFDSVKGRALSLLHFFEKLAILPLALLYKFYRTFFRFLGVLLAFFLLVVTLCLSETVRGLFVKRVASLAQDIADWIMWPMAVASCLGRMLLAAFIHPALYL